MQSVVDGNCSLRLAKVHVSKVPRTAVDVLNDRVLPFYEEHEVGANRILTDDGRKYCGRQLHHSHELFLAISQIVYRRAETPSPETSGVRGRLGWTVKGWFLGVAFRQRFYRSLAELQQDLCEYLTFSNPDPAHQSYRTKGRTPYQAFSDGVKEITQAEAA